MTRRKDGSLHKCTHGCYSTYAVGCRCVQCRQANSDHTYERVHGHKRPVILDISDAIDMIAEVLIG